jgi:hypothetical protein
VWCQKELALAITGEIARQGITVIPLRIGNTLMPATLKDKKYLTLDAARLDASVAELIRDMQLHLQPLPPRRRATAPTALVPTLVPTGARPCREPTVIPTFKVIGIDLDRLGKPRADGTRGSALYAVPFNLDGRPNAEWSGILRQNWDHPPSFTTMHRPGIAHVRAGTIVLDGTTMEEVRRYHLGTLKLAVAETNKQYVAAQERRHAKEAAADQAERQRLEEARRIAGELDFD